MALNVEDPNVIKAAITQAGTEVTAAEDHAGEVGASLLGAAQNAVAEDVNTVLKGLADLLRPINAAVPQVMALLTHTSATLDQIVDRGLVITIALGPPPKV